LVISIVDGDRVERRNSQYALYVAACMRGGLQPDLLSNAGWWQTPLWQYSVFAVVIYSRAAPERLAVSIEEVARRIAARTASSSPRDQLWSRGGGTRASTWLDRAARRDQFMTNGAESRGLQGHETGLSEGPPELLQKA
jgi:hypothetical protein